MVDTFNYKGYLEEWENQFEDEEYGIFSYWQYGKLKQKRLKKMSKEEHALACQMVDNLGRQIDNLQAKPEYKTNEAIGNKVDALLMESFDYELALFC